MNILFVAEKPSIAKEFLNVINEHKDEFIDNYYVDYVHFVAHFNDKVSRFRKYNNEYYQNRKKSGFKPLKLKDLNIPSDTFLQVTDSRFAYKNSAILSNMDEIICICDSHDQSKLAFAKYLEDHNLDIKKVKYIELTALTENTIYKKLKEPYIDFFDVYEKLKEKLIKNKFKAEYPREKDITLLRMESNMKRTEFANYFNIPYRTVENWERNTAKCPEYLYDLMEYKLWKDEMLIEKYE